MQTNFNSESNAEERNLRRVLSRITQTMERDDLVQQTTDELRDQLQTDRVVLYYFYQLWKGRVAFESLSSSEYSILGQTGPDGCFNGEYASMYEEGRIRAIKDIEVEPITPCHREFLRGMRVRANLVVPVLTAKGLWGLLVAHHCRDIRAWSSSDIESMQSAAQTLADAPSIRES